MLPHEWRYPVPVAGAGGATAQDASTKSWSFQPTVTTRLGHYERGALRERPVAQRLPLRGQLFEVVARRGVAVGGIDEAIVTALTLPRVRREQRAVGAADGIMPRW